MATVPYFLLSPSTILSVVGLLRGPDPTIPTPADDWRDARVDVVIPAYNESTNIPFCLAALMRQTLKPRRIVLIDDGSSDDTIGVATAFADLHGLEITAIRRRAPIGKTPTIKRQVRELDSDVTFILDADTVLESEHYIARTVEMLYQAPGIASACGTILPLRRSDRRRWLEAPDIRNFFEAHPGHGAAHEHHRVRELARDVTNLYKESLYLFLQKLVYRGQNTLLGTITNPVGCAVAYRRTYARDLFAECEPMFGDDLTNSEDIFIGFAMLDMGYRNIQLTDVYARTLEPPLYRLPRQLYLWSSSFLQSCYYFDPLLRSPFRTIAHWWHAYRSRRQAQAAAEHGMPLTPAFPHPAAGERSLFAPKLRVAAARETTSTAAGASSFGGRERRRRSEPYRQPFGRAFTRDRGRPAGWMLLMEAIEKVFFPTTLLILIILGAWWSLLLTVAIETGVNVGVLAWAMKGQRLEYVLKGIAVAPIRYACLAGELVTIARFASDLWIRRYRGWRK